LSGQEARARDLPAAKGNLREPTIGLAAARVATQARDELELGAAMVARLSQRAAPLKMGRAQACVRAVARDRLVLEKQALLEARVHARRVRVDELDGGEARLGLLLNTESRSTPNRGRHKLAHHPQSERFVQPDRSGR
jgi:hypothetical protein